MRLKAKVLYFAQKHLASRLLFETSLGGIFNTTEYVEN